MSKPHSIEVALKNEVVEKVKALTQFKDLGKVEALHNEAIRQLAVPILGKLEIGTASLISFSDGKPMVTIKKGFAAVGEFSINQLMKEEYAGKLKT